MDRSDLVEWLKTGEKSDWLRELRDESFQMNFHPRFYRCLARDRSKSFDGTGKILHSGG